MKASVAVAVLLLSFAWGRSPGGTSPSSPKPADPVQASAPSTVDSAKAADIRKLMSLVNTEELATGLLGAMTEQIRPMITNSLPPGEYREKEEGRQLRAGTQPIPLLTELDADLIRVLQTWRS